MKVSVPFKLIDLEVPWWTQWIIADYDGDIYAVSPPLALEEVGDEPQANVDTMSWDIPGSCLIKKVQDGKSPGSIVFPNWMYMKEYVGPKFLVIAPNTYDLALYKALPIFLSKGGWTISSDMAATFDSTEAAQEELKRQKLLRSKHVIVSKNDMLDHIWKVLL